MDRKFAHRRRPRGQGVAQFTNAALEHRMPLLGRDLRQGLQHEPPLVQRGMRYGQPARVHNGVAEEQDVQVNYPRALGLGALPPHRFFYPLQGGKKLFGHLFRGQGCGAVQKPGLARELHWLGFIE